MTGGAGYVSSHCAFMSGRGERFGVVFDNLLFGHREFVRWGPLIEGDIRNSAALDAVFSAQRFSVMHFAALASVTGPGRYYDVNVNGTRTPDGTPVRDYIHVCDLANAHVLALKYLFDCGDTIAVNLGTGHGASVRQVIDTARRITRCEIVARGASRRAGDPPMLVADPKKAGEVLGWAPHRSTSPPSSPTPGAGITNDLVSTLYEPRTIQAKQNYETDGAASQAGGQRGFP